MQEANSFLKIKVAYKKGDLTKTRVYFNQSFNHDEVFTEHQVKVGTAPLKIKVTNTAVYFTSIGECLECQINEVKKWIYHNTL